MVPARSVRLSDPEGTSRSSFRRHLSYANVMATIAVFIALGGTATAAFVVTGKNVKNSSLTGADVKNSSITGADLTNNSVGSVDIKDGDLLASDFKPGQLDRGCSGSVGSEGRSGCAGAAGGHGRAGAARNPRG
ncbi:MAG: hypothetical protein AVDCRST_MAG85-3824 [uncultured Solirubrobacteraceae bacterium]|uniref:Uncharacterized protein n=1 Tax=uncultured Solirubrobacteraceae bacterium TaxID=1162706 RepID=A0A6J4TWG8_9ACTN|nr:MAG: hypothetical protein AVDCRST_MAG85-3824 [uncultured Solirubrobacteraceae bacterium]